MCLKECTIAVVMVCLLSAVSAATTSRHQRDPGFAGKMTWSCVNNASCIEGVTKDIMGRLSRKQPVDFGILKVIPQEHKALVEGRSSKFMDFLSGNAVEVPLGPMVFGIQRSEEYDGYIEVSLLKKGGDDEGRHGHGKRRPLMRMFIPSFLAFNAVGWMMLAVMSVGLLTFKAFALSKIAFLVAAAMTMRRMMGHQTMDHPEYLPYNGYDIDSPLTGAVASGSEFMPYHLSPDLQMYHQQQQQQQQQQLQPLTAESNIVAAVESANNATSQLVPKIKRQDLSATFRRRPVYYVAQRSPILTYRSP
ncbi:uncharacterized protein DMENIID0001_018760 [Sergentomyia squamirostris]